MHVFVVDADSSYNGEVVITNRYIPCGSINSLVNSCKINFIVSLYVLLWVQTFFNTKAFPVLPMSTENNK